MMTTESRKSGGPAACRLCREPLSDTVADLGMHWQPAPHGEGKLLRCSRNPNGEPQLSHRGLYRSFAGADQALLESALLWVMSLADGEHTTLDMAEQAELPFAVAAEAASALVRVDLLRRESPRRSTKGGGR